MKRLSIAIAVGLLGLLGTMGFTGGSTPAEAGSVPLPAEWSPLSETCNDVSGDGLVDLPNDILQVILHFGAQWGDDDYALLFDNAAFGDPSGADGVIDLPNDILGTILTFDQSGSHGPVEYGGDGANCSLLDTQIIRSAAALLPYQDCQAAAADGYESTGVYVPDMGIHISKLSNLKTTFDPEAGWDGIDASTATDLANPFGLVCSIDQETGGVGKLIGPWYIIPVQSTGELYGKAPPFQPDNTPPVGFDTDADYISYNESTGGVQAAWHKHINLCVGVGFLAEQGPGYTEQEAIDRCISVLGGFLNVPLYGWMLHLYNFVPNTTTAANQANSEPPANSPADPRFMRWNRNPSFPVCEYSASGCGGGGGAVAGVQEGAFVCPIFPTGFLDPEA